MEERTVEAVAAAFAAGACVVSPVKICSVHARLGLFCAQLLQFEQSCSSLSVASSKQIRPIGDRGSDLAVCNVAAILVSVCVGRHVGCFAD